MVNLRRGWWINHNTVILWVPAFDVGIDYRLKETSYNFGWLRVIRKHVL